MDLTHAHERLVEESAGVFSPETVDECLREATLALMRQARIETHVAVLAERFARERLRATGQAVGAIVKEVPEVLFVCVHNAGRSQMAAGLLDHRAEGRVHVRSAGSTQADQINPAVVRATEEIGLDLSREFPKPLTTDVVEAADVVVTMGCGDACPVFPGKRYLDWELVRRKWTFGRRFVGGRPPIRNDVRDLILRMGRENPRWGCIRIRGELAKLGIWVSATKIRTLLRASGLGPAPRRSWPSWSEFLRSQAHGILALDFLTVETIALRTMYVLFAIHLGSRRVHVLGVTRNPDSAWVTQQARNLAVGERLRGIRFVIRDHDSKFPGPFDEVYRSEGLSIVRTPIRAPRANAYAERWVRTVRTECLDWMLVLGRRHLEHVFRAYVTHYNRARPHRGLDLRTPEPRPDRAPWPTHRPRVGTRHVLGGLIREYELAA